MKLSSDTLSIAPSLGWWGIAVRVQCRYHSVCFTCANIGWPGKNVLPPVWTNIAQN